MNNEKLKFEPLIKKYQIEDSYTLKIYLTNIWQELTLWNDNNNNNIQGISKASLAKYYKLPGIILDRFFYCLDKHKKKFISLKDFLKGMITLFTGNFEELASLIFKIYDYDCDGLIDKEDIRIVLSYIPLNENNFFKTNNNLNEFEKIIESQEELHNKIDEFLDKNQKINKNEFFKIIEDKNSDIFLYLLLLLYERRPFTKKTLKIYKDLRKSPNSSPKNQVKNNKKICLKKDSFKIISPSKKTVFNVSKSKKSSNHSSLLFDNLNFNSISSFDISKENDENINNFKKRNCNYSDNLFNFCEAELSFNNENDENRMNSSFSQPNIMNVKKKSNKKIDYLKFPLNSDSDIDNSILKNELPENNLDNPNSQVFNNSLSSIDKFSEPEKNSFIDSLNDSNSDYEENELIPNFSGYMYKIINESKLKKLWFNLYNKDLFYHHSKNNKSYVGMLNLSGIFLKEMSQVHFMTYNFYCFKLISPHKSRLFYIENKEEYDGWIINIKKAINYSDINETYTFSEKLEKGKFGPIKKGFNKKTKKQVVISFFAKKYMNQSDFEQITNQIQILKICKHPNIGNLIDVFETSDFIYLINEYYPGLDLFDYFEKRNFHLKEKNVARIIQQLSSVIYFLGEYGIIHRDLKLENILMTNETDNADIKLLDFFSAVFISPKYYHNEIIGSISYASPEILENKPWNQKTDLWSLGIITYFLLTGFLPFEDENNDEENVAKQIINLPVTYPENIWNNISYIAKDFVENLLQKNPENRMNIKQCLEHPWIQTNCETTLKSYGCKIRRNKNEKVKKIPGGVIFKMYSSPYVKYMNLGDQDELKKFLIFNNDNDKGNRIKNINKIRKKIRSFKITTTIETKNNLGKNYNKINNKKHEENNKINNDDKNTLSKNI